MKLYEDEILDAHGYPLEPYLEHIRKYELLKYGWDSLVSDIIEPFIHYGRHSLDPAPSGDYYVLTLVTGGWSGCEETIDALQDNVCFWRYWNKTERGGLYEFILPIDNRQEAK